MKLFIRIKDGQPFGNPITESNFIRAFPDVGIDNLPPEFARFSRVEKPRPNYFEVWDGTTYEWDGDVVTDVHHVRPMNSRERYEKIEFMRITRPNESWTWREEEIRWIPPERPTTIGPWEWDQSIQDWAIATAPPFPSWVVSEDGTRYVAPTPMPEGTPHAWDEETLIWVEVNLEELQSNG